MTTPPYGLARASRRLAVAALVLGGCGSPPPADAVDAGADARTACTADVECSDGVFCNGVERCVPTDAAADARGCAPSEAPACAATEVCSEAMEACAPACEEPDADGDGADSMRCGGSDCDDTDADVNPSATEVCDPEGVDEDCDPATFGATDADGDGYISTACCNGASCGDDCDDTRATVHPDEAESCNGRDEDCDTAIDEDAAILPTWYRDEDGDGWGDSSEGAPTMITCAEPMPVGEWSSMGGDCDDTRAAVNPAADENPLMPFDEDCDGQINETYELRGDIESLGGIVRSTTTSLRILHPQLESTTSRVCSATSTRCVTGGIVSGDFHP